MEEVEVEEGSCIMRVWVCMRIILRATEVEQEEVVEAEGRPPSR